MILAQKNELSEKVTCVAAAGQPTNEHLRPWNLLAAWRAL
jgi:hypothetical protein